MFLDDKDQPLTFRADHCISLALEGKPKEESMQDSYIYNFALPSR
jgi:hypothetical protein